MMTLVFFLEGPSEKEMLHGLLPKLIPAGINVRYLVFRGKQDLEKNLVRRLRGWQLPDSAFMVMRDQDAGDCHQIKKKLVEYCRASGKTGWLVRIACREMESFFLGDLIAVEQGLGVNNLRGRQHSRIFRNPDVLANPAVELKKLTDQRYNKLSGSRAIGPHLSIENNRSHSFNALIAGIRRLVEAI
ncbi:DUF4276 family protein [Desulfobulbus alkaliphilus]|uniref:DUF4276 family protein n=1 Tax=Desulfobulbus alkaliphilus TaxID=869814 RepID=UPI0019655989|nr:DUF4276 family protein [Desulfobulbus alkaliphilus]MBM9536233.1 DUF4276 family protein [Desulfobulbus alkaliphilus]